MNNLHCIATNDRKSTQNGGTVTYNHHKSNKISIVKEDSRLCDGIGGVIWDGALLMSFVLEELIPNLGNDTSIIELGAGAGLTSIVSQKCITSDETNVISTDRYIDLLDINITNNNLSNKIISAVLDWKNPEEAHLLKHIKKNVIIIGVEIACLVKQQKKLINTIKNLCNDNINSMILITFDETTENESNYEKQFIEHMAKEGYISAIIFTGSIEWNENETIAYVHDITNSYHHDLKHFAFPGNRNEYKEIKTSKEEPPPIPKVSNSDSNNNNHRSTLHHVLAFYQPRSVRTCQRCHKSYLPFLNDKCAHHKGLYVCRFHPSECKSNINGLGDGEGYYCGAKDGYQAKFWDCCGNEDINSRGCCYSFHCGYS